MKVVRRMKELVKSAVRRVLADMGVKPVVFVIVAWVFWTSFTGWIGDLSWQYRVLWLVVGTVSGATATVVIYEKIIKLAYRKGRGSLND